MNLKTWWDATFAVEVLLLLVSAPVLYFPSRFPLWTIYISVSLLALGWVWRRWRLDIWFRRTPADYPIFFLFLIMLPVSLWAAPEPLRIKYSIPKAYILVWNFFLFWTIVTHASRSWRLAQVAMAGFITAGMMIAISAPFGTVWNYKFPGFDLILRPIPSPLVGAFQGAESGFHPNQVAGTLLYVLPLVLAMAAGTVWHLWRTAQRMRADWLVAGLLLSCALIMSGVFLLTQSRAGLAGLAASLAVMVLVNWRWGSLTLLAGFLVLVVTLVIAPNELIEFIADAPPAEVLGGTSTLGFRQEVWGAAVLALHDFPFTGMGLGTFREIVGLLYPLDVMAPGDDIGHAHNFLIQTGLDFGLPGMIAVLAVYLIATLEAVSTWKRTGDNSNHAYARFWSTGFIGFLVAQGVYSQLDAVALGAKTNLFLWYIFALISATFLMITDTRANH